MRALAVYIGGSTLTSTIPGLSVAGRTPEDTLYTPTLDLEYLVAGAPVSAQAVPVTPEGLPTPAVITRSVLQLVRVPYMVVDAGTFYGIGVPHVRLPHARPGGNIAEGGALPPGTARLLYEEARLLGRSLGRGMDLVLVGESIPGGTTVAAAIMSALGHDGVSLVSSASPANPKALKRSVVERALARARGLGDVFSIVDAVGDPVHVSMAGLAAGAWESGARVMLAGGTQMGAVLAILRSLGLLDAMRGRLSVGTTKWVWEDGSADMRAIAEEVGGGVEVLVARVGFEDSPYEGLRKYEEGYVKEGVGAGGTMVLANMLGVSWDEMKRAVYDEYARLVGLAKG